MAMSAVLAIFILFCDAARADKESVIAFDFKGTKITFPKDKFEDFYNCLCNPFLNPCWAISEKKMQNVTEVNITEVKKKFNPSDQISIRKCIFTETISRELIMNCTRSTSRSNIIHFKPVTQNLNDTCTETHMKLDWPEDVTIIYNYSSIVNISPKETKVTQAPEKEISTPVVLDNYNIVNKIVIAFDFKGIKIKFPKDKFEDFYKCLCNPVLDPCWAISEKKMQNVPEVRIRDVKKKYNPSENSIRKCIFYETISRELIMNCTRSSSGSHIINFKPVKQSLKDTCTETTVKLDWPEDVKIIYNYLSIRNISPKDTQVTQSPGNEISSPVLSMMNNNSSIGDISTNDTQVTQSPENEISSPVLSMMNNYSSIVDISPNDTQVTQSTENEISSPFLSMMKNCSSSNDTSLKINEVTQKPENGISAPIILDKLIIIMVVVVLSSSYLFI